MNPDDRVAVAAPVAPVPVETMRERSMRRALETIRDADHENALMLRAVAARALRGDDQPANRLDQTAQTSFNSTDFVADTAFDASVEATNTSIDPPEYAVKSSAAVAAELNLATGTEASSKALAHV